MINAELSFILSSSPLVGALTLKNISAFEKSELIAAPASSRSLSETHDRFPAPGSIVTV